jgi:hypothetical protein
MKKLLLLLILLPSPSFSDQKTEEIFLVSGALGDILSTELGLSQPHTRELNPWAQETWQRVALKSSVTSAILLLGRHLDRKGKHSTAKYLRLTSASFWWFGTGWNLSITLSH